MIVCLKATLPTHFADASRLIDAYQRYIMEQNLTMCMMGSLDDEIASPAKFYRPEKGGVFLAYPQTSTGSKKQWQVGHSALSLSHGVGQETEAGDNPIGICCMEEHQPVHTDLKTAEIRRMYVAENARGQKVGEALLEACENEALKLGYRRVVLDTFQDPTYALKLYKRLGFTECAPFNHLPLDKAVWLEKML